MDSQTLLTPIPAPDGGSKPMDFGVHLPLMDFGGNPFTLDHFVSYAESARALGYRALAANDHLVASKPWLDGPTALAAVLSHSGDLDLVTSVALPVVRGPVPLAKTLAALDRLSGGRLLVCLGPGSASRDFALVGVPYEERWKRFDESIQALRSLLNPEAAVFKGSTYSTEGVRLQPFPARPSAFPLWVGSWGSPAGLRRVARLGDGWLASAANTTPELFARGLAQLRQFLLAAGKDPASFPNAISTLWLYISEDERETQRVLTQLLAPALFRPVAELRQRALVGSARECADKIAAYRAAGAGRLYLWPVTDELRQIELFINRVVPLIDRRQ